MKVSFFFFFFFLSLRKIGIDSGQGVQLPEQSRALTSKADTENKQFKGRKLSNPQQVIRLKPVSHR